MPLKSTVHDFLNYYLLMYSLTCNITFISSDFCIFPMKQWTDTNMSALRHSPLAQPVHYWVMSNLHTREKHILATWVKTRQF